ncbi:dolichyl-phosphate beta-glucosyltransferase [Umbelopsis sp. WA50703]
MDLIYGLIALLVTVVAAGLGFLLYCSPKPRKPTEKEQYYIDRTGKSHKHPSILDDASVRLSCIVPAFDESKRLPIMLQETIGHLESRQQKVPKFTYEIIVVDDGSRDDTVDVALKFAQKHKDVDLRVLPLEKNRGKGGAVTQGMLAARGEICLMVDADGATKFSDLDDLEEKLSKCEKDGYGIAVGSRSHLVSTDAVVQRSFIRNFLMRGFHALVYFLGIRGIEDTQCGFKLFTRKAAQLIFPNMHVERWIFDIECLVIAQGHRIPITEVQVTWQEIDGSKVNLMRDSIQMALDLLTIRLNFLLGIWKVDSIKKQKSQ